VLPKQVLRSLLDYKPEEEVSHQMLVLTDVEKRQNNNSQLKEQHLSFSATVLEISPSPLSTEFFSFCDLGLGLTSSCLSWLGNGISEKKKKCGTGEKRLPLFYFECKHYFGFFCYEIQGSFNLLPLIQVIKLPLGLFNCNR
jgi:hypothetical protein